MTGRWFKTPDGRSLRRQPSPLEQYLRKNEPPLAASRDIVPSLSEQPAASADAEPDYRTDDSDPRQTRGCEVTVFGAGSVGSHLVYYMAPGGLTFNVIDCKAVEYKHVRGGRTAYDSTHIGLMKVEALKRKIEAEHLGASVRPYPFDVAELTTLDLRDMLERSWVVILAIDDPEQILRISDLAYPMVDVIQTAMHAQGRTSHIAISMPLLTPCLRCTLGITGSQDLTRLDSEPASSLDIMNLANQGARFAADIVYSKVTGQQITRWDISKNLIYLSHRMDQFSPAGPGLHYEVSQRRPGCPICNPTGPQ